jgi:hypothetical protein
MTKYTALLPKRPNIVGSPDQVYHFNNFLTALIKGIDNGIIAAIGTVDSG